MEAKTHVPHSSGVAFYLPHASRDFVDAGECGGCSSTPELR